MLFRSSSPKIYPAERTFLMIRSPSYRQEFVPVPKIQAIPGLSISKPLAAANKSLSAEMGVLNCATNEASRMFFLSRLAHPAP